MMLSVNKIKGVALIVFGISWIIFVYNFDALMNRPAVSGTKAIIGLAFGIISIINGFRIFLRK